jgi:arylsulfatase A-like enzyme
VTWPVRHERLARSSRRRWWLAAHLAIAATVLGGVGCGVDERAQTDTPAATEPLERAARRDLNIVLVTIDTLRTDRLSCYGSDRVDTPNIDSFAEEGVLFTNAATTVPFTLPAHSSILTGLYPPGHGVRENVGYTLDPRVPTLAEVLSTAGWSTAGFISAFVLDGRWGIARGFDHYFDDFDLSGFESANLSSVQRTGDVTVAEAIRWLDRRPSDRPFFLWLHLYDPHDPYEPPEPYKSAFATRPYDGEVAFTDSLIGEFRKALEDRGLLGSTMVILTSDHGEGLGDHGEASHGFFLYDTTVHVGLIVRLPGGEPAGRTVDAAVSHVDLMPTILDAVNVDPPRPVHGESLIPLIEGGDRDPSRGVYSESLYPLLHYGWAPLRAYRTEDHKLVSAPRPEVFDVRADPREEHDLSLVQPAVLAELEAGLDGLRSVIEPAAPTTAAAPDLDPQTVAQTPEERRQYSLVDQVGAATPPAFLVHAYDDNVVPIRESELYAGALAAAGHEVEVHFFAAGGHGFGPGRPEDRTDQWLPLLANWIRRQ